MDYIQHNCNTIMTNDIQYKHLPSAATAVSSEELSIANKAHVILKQQLVVVQQTKKGKGL